MGYKILLFDLDDTLLDFSANEEDSLNKLFRRHGYALSDELLGTYRSINVKLWCDYENGRITLDEALNSRFSQTLRRLGRVVDGAEWERQYRELLEDGQELIDGAGEVCRRLSAAHRLFVVSNGIAVTQTGRLHQAGLDSFFEDVFISESVGFQKPAREFFTHVAAHIDGFREQDALIVGNSLDTDIRGGLLAGIDTCWFNKQALACRPDVRSKFTIKSLTELYAICD